METRFRHQAHGPEGVPALNATPEHSGRSRLGGWGQLFRLPNLFTAPGDPLAGFALASVSLAGVNYIFMLPAAVASLLLYAAGVVQNDVAHLPHDRIHRPDRPLVTGAVRRGHALAATVVLAVAAMFSAWLTASPATCYVAFTLLVLITLYNHYTSRVAVVGPLNMGLCRGVSLLVGASAAGGWAAMGAPPVLAAAAMLVLYTAAVTSIARRENRTATVGLVRWAPAIVLLAGFAVIFMHFRILSGREVPVAAASITVQLLALGLALRCERRLDGKCSPQRIQQTIGLFIRGLLLVQAALVCSAGHIGLWLCFALVLAWPITGTLARRFKPS